MGGMNDSDIDFDELDRAVSSLVGGGTYDEAAAGDAIKVQRRKPDSEAPVKHQHGAARSESEEGISVVVTVDHKRTHAAKHVAAASPLAAKRTGRMMDIIKPAAAVHKPATSIRARGPSREGVGLQPFGAAEQSADNEVTAVPEAPVHKPQDYHVDGFLDDERERAYFLEENSDQAELAPVPILPDSATQQSPFITDARVEKRPLGSDGTIGDLNSPFTNNSATSTKIVSPAPRLSIESLPEELNSEIIAIESGLAVDKPLPVRQVTSTPRPASSVFTAPLAATVPSAAVSDQPVAIFDTDHYHQQLRHPDSQESGWRFVFGVILLLLLGALSGAALYYFNII